MARRRTLDLSKQQHRILELMARGRTNYDIAQEMDISLEGAKYHIRQVFDKLGVDSREEAVAVWRESRGSVFERVRGFLWPVGALAAGGVVAAGVVVGVAGLAMGGGPSTPTRTAINGASTPPVVTPAPPNAWIAEIEPNADSAGSPAPMGLLEVYKAGDRAHAHVFAGLTVQGGNIAWSPDGEHLAVEVIREDGPVNNDVVPGLFIFTRTPSGWTQTSVAIETDMFGWSRKGDLLAAADVGNNGTNAVLLDGSGKVVAQATAPLSPGNAPVTQAGPLWSPDGTTAAWGLNGAAVVLSSSGAHAYAQPDSAVNGLVVNSWSGPDTLDVTSQSLPNPPPRGAQSSPTQTVTAPVGYEVRFDGAEATWNRSSLPPPVPTNPLTALHSQPVPANVASALQEQPGNVTEVGITADGRGKVFVPNHRAASPSDPPVDYRIAVELPGGQITIATLGTRLPVASGYNMAFDVVVMGQPG